MTEHQVAESMLCFALMKKVILFSTVFWLVALPVSAITLAEAADTTGLAWTSGGEAAWQGANGITHDAVDALESGALPDGAESWVQTQLEF
jgi:hypothetical protein